MFGQYSDPRKFTAYRLYMPGSWDIVRVLEVAAEFTQREPVILNTPALSGDWEVGYCDHDNYQRALKEVKRWYQPQAQAEL